jgi:bacteriocin biosynthesis cyclodehydratase domain-containing protein
VATPYELIAGTRPRIRRDVLFTQSPSGVLFHNADGGFNISGATAYRFASLLVPHLDGGAEVADLCAGLGERQRDMIVEVVRTLYDRGFARDAAPEADAEPLPPALARRFSPQVEYIDHYVGDSVARFRRFRGTRIAVLGDDPVARWCVLSLVRNGAAEIAVSPAIDQPGNAFDEVLAEAGALDAEGCSCRIAWLPGGGEQAETPGWAQLADYDIVLVTGADAGRRVLALLAAGVPQGRRLLAAWTYGAKVVIGPLMSDATAGCWACAALRLGANTEPGAAADLWSAAALPDADGAAQVTGPLAGMVGNLLAYEVFRLTTGALPADTEGKILVQDLDSLDTWSEPLLPHPSCPYCSPSAIGADPDHAAELTTADPDTWEPQTQSPQTAADLEADLLSGPQEVLAELEARSRLVQPHAGVFTAFDDEVWNQSPIKIGTVRFGLGHTVRRSVSAFDLHHVAGARISALHAAARTYVEHVVPVAGVLSGARLDAARRTMPHLDPRRLAIASGTGAHPDLVSAWAPATRVTTGERVLVPAAALRTFGPHNHERICLSTTAGTGTGPTPAAALAQGLLSALALDAVISVLKGTAPAGRVALDLLGADPELAFLAKSAGNLGVEVDLLDLGDRDGRAAPVLLARAHDPEDGADLWTAQCAPLWRDAAVRALRDLLGQVQLARQLGGAARVDPGDALLGDLDAGALPIAAEAAPDPAAPAPAWREVVARLRSGGDDVLFAPAGSADLAAAGIAAAKVLLVRGSADGR